MTTVKRNVGSVVFLAVKCATRINCRHHKRVDRDVAKAGAATDQKLM
jgi:hypothetical protein